MRGRIIKRMDGNVFESSFLLLTYIPYMNDKCDNRITTNKQPSSFLFPIFIFLFPFVYRLHTGWSAGRTTSGNLKPEEQAAIISVIKRNEALEMSERQRVGKLVDRVEKIKQRAAECGPRYCR